MRAGLSGGSLSTLRDRNECSLNLKGGRRPASSPNLSVSPRTSLPQRRVVHDREIPSARAAYVKRLAKTASRFVRRLREASCAAQYRPLRSLVKDSPAHF